MITDCTECYYNENQAYVLCKSHKKISFPAKIQYDELYKDCNIEMVIPKLGEHVFVCNAGHGMPEPLNMSDLGDCFNRSEIPLWNVFEKQVNNIKKFQFMSLDDIRMMSLLRNADKALASFDFNGTFETNGKFEMGIDETALKAFIWNWESFPKNKPEDLIIDAMACIKLKRIE